MKKVILILAVALIGCTHLEKGHVVDKIYEPDRTYMIMMPMVRSNGKTTYTTYYPMLMHDNEDFILTIEDSVDGEIVHENVYVTEDYFNKYNLGDV